MMCLSFRDLLIYDSFKEYGVWKQVTLNPQPHYQFPHSKSVNCHIQWVFRCFFIHGSSMVHPPGPHLPTSWSKGSVRAVRKAVRLSHFCWWTPPCFGFFGLSLLNHHVFIFRVGFCPKKKWTVNPPFLGGETTIFGWCFTPIFGSKTHRFLLLFGAPLHPTRNRREPIQHWPPRLSSQPSFRASATVLRLRCHHSEVVHNAVFMGWRRELTRKNKGSNYWTSKYLDLSGQNVKKSKYDENIIKYTGHVACEVYINLVLHILRIWCNKCTIKTPKKNRSPGESSSQVENKIIETISDI